jgi:uncharacterized membrane protein
VLIVVYLAAWALHVLWPTPFLRITPDWVPWPRATILVTGLCEIAGATGLAIPRTRRLAGVMLALYAVCVYPVNILHAVHDLSTGTGLGWTYHYPRLFAQPLICWWALAAGGLARRGA